MPTVDLFIFASRKKHIEKQRDKQSQKTEGNQKL